MATAIDSSTALSSLVAILQANQNTASWLSTVDGANLQWASDSQFSSAILYADAEVCNVIITTPGQPYQNAFSQTSSALSSGDNLPSRNGLVLKVQCLNTIDTTFVYTAVDTSADTITVSPGNRLETGTKVRFTTGGALPTGLSINTDYYAVFSSVVSSTSSKFSFAASRSNAFNNVIIDLTTTGSGTSTIVAQYEDGVQARSKDEVLGATIYPTNYGNSTPSVAGFWFIEGDVIYTTSGSCKAVYCDYTKTSSPQAPEPYLNAVVAGAVVNLMEDGMDQAMAAYYRQIFEDQKAIIRSGASELPAITAYKG